MNAQEHTWKTLRWKNADCPIALVCRAATSATMPASANKNDPHTCGRPALAVLRACGAPGMPHSVTDVASQAAGAEAARPQHLLSSSPHPSRRGCAPALPLVHLTLRAREPLACAPRAWPRDSRPPLHAAPRRPTLLGSRPALRRLRRARRQWWPVRRCSRPRRWSSGPPPHRMPGGTPRAAA